MVKENGYQDFVASVDVARGETADVNASLARSTPSPAATRVSFSIIPLMGALGILLIMKKYR
jgi:hypothetical protein